MEAQVTFKNRLQDVQQFTVQIRHGETDAVVGTGVAITMSGEVVTCKHVAEAAGINLAEDTPTGEVSIYFPKSSSHNKTRRATLARYFSDADDDVVVLKTIGESPLAPEQIAILSDGERSDSGNAMLNSSGLAPRRSSLARSTSRL